MYHRYFITFLSNSQSIFLPNEDNKRDRNLNLFILKFLHNVTIRFIATVLTIHPSIITHFHQDIFNPNLFMNTISEAVVPSPSGDLSYIFQPAKNPTTLHLSSLMIQTIMDSVLKLYGESSNLIPNSLPILTKYLFI